MGMKEKILTTRDLARRWGKDLRTIARYRRVWNLQSCARDGVGEKAGYLFDLEEVKRFEEQYNLYIHEPDVE
jgi:hypothetical protein